jgi:hypothetical protein
MRKLSEFYTAEVMDSYFHLCGRGQHYNHINVVCIAGLGVAIDRVQVISAKCYTFKPLNLYMLSS